MTTALRSLAPAREVLFSHIREELPLSPDEYHGAGGVDEDGLVNAVAVLLFHHDGADISDQIVVGSAFTQHDAEVVIVLAEKQGAAFAVGGAQETGAMAR